MQNVFWDTFSKELHISIEIKPTGIIHTMSISSIHYNISSTPYLQLNFAWGLITLQKDIYFAFSKEKESFLQISDNLKHDS